MDNNYYVNLRLSAEESRGHILYLQPFIDAISRRIDNPRYPILEVGIGTGLCCSFLQKDRGFINSFGIDNNPLLVKRFNEEIKHRIGSNVQVKLADAFDLTEVAEELSPLVCIYHQGLLEHFSDADIIRLLDHHVNLADRYVIFAVPVEGHIRDGLYDIDEVHYPISWWLELLKRYKLYEYGVFGIDISKNQAFFVIGKK